MNYEQKYKNALKWARLVKDGRIDFDITAVEKVFPELAESEDEKIRKQIISFLKEFEHDHYRSLDFSSWIDWLEKQGTKEVDPRYENLEELLAADDIYQMSMNDAMVEEAKSKAINALSELEISKLLGIEKQGEQNPANKIEPKFHVGDWIVNNGHSYLIATIEDDRYLFEIGGCTHEQLNWEYIENADKKYHLWTIKDAKDGDVLTVNGRPFIYCCNDDYEGNYCCIDSDGVFRTSLDFGFNGKTILPATKEQRDTFFTKMKEEGYEWNAEKKELKKIEPDVQLTENHAWSEDDECYMTECINAITTKDGWSFEEKRNTKHWLKSLKERVLPQNT